MPSFDYRAFDSAGRPVTGRIDADSRTAALRRLSDQGLLPVDAAEASGTAVGASGMAGLFRRKPRAADVTLFTQELALLLGSGQPLAAALSLIEADTATPRVQGIARRLRTSISAGRSLAEALAAEPETFPPVYIGMVKAAEAAGNLESVLGRIAETREREERLRSRFASALLYPALLVVLAVLTVIMMIAVVVPRFKEMLGTDTERLPASSRAILAASDWLTANAETLLVGLAASLVALLVLGRRPSVRRALESLLLATPLIGTMMRLSLTARFCRTLGILLSSGLGLPAALALTRDVIGSERARAVIDRIGIALREGKDFTEPLRDSAVFPPLVTSLLRIGAESGTLSTSGLRLADMYEVKLDIAMQRLITILEPAIILFVSIFIGFIVLSIMSAIVGVYDLTGA